MLQLARGLLVACTRVAFAGAAGACNATVGTDFAHGGLGVLLQLERGLSSRVPESRLPALLALATPPIRTTSLMVASASCCNWHAGFPSRANWFVLGSVTGTCHAIVMSDFARVGLGASLRLDRGHLSARNRFSCDGAPGTCDATHRADFAHGGLGVATVGTRASCRV